MSALDPRRVHATAVNGALETEGRVRTLSPDALLGRYHELVDRRFEGTLRVSEDFELQRIEARLDFGDTRELHQLSTFQNAWERERNALIESAEHLLNTLKSGK